MYIGIPQGVALAYAPDAYPPRIGEAEQCLYDQYVRSCAGVRVLSRLERTSRTPLERVEFLERKVRFIPRLFEFKRRVEADLRADPANPVNHVARRALQDLVNRIFGPGYALSSEEAELARARCELSRARWELAVFNRTGRLPEGRLRRRP